MGDEVRAAPWAMAALDSSKELRCRATISDTIMRDMVSEDLNSATMWLFTSKSGEIMRKRASQSASNVLDRFSRIALSFASNEHKLACQLRYRDGHCEALGVHGFSNLIEKGWPPTDHDFTILALQCFIPGRCYRNCYQRTRAGGMSITRIIARNPGKSRDKPQLQTTPGIACEAKLYLPESATNACPLSRAVRINTTLDAATKSILRFLEKSQKVIISAIELEYVVDERSQLWLTWIGDATLSPTLEATALTNNLNSINSVLSDHTVLTQDSVRIAQHSVAENTVGKQVNQAVSRIEETNALRPSTTPAQDSISAKWKSTEDEGWPVRRIKERCTSPKMPTSVDKNKFPSRLECAGDYCSFEVREPKTLFAASEVLKLNVALPDMMKTHQHPPMHDDQLVSLAFKSVHLARVEKRGLQSIKQKEDDYHRSAPWREYPETPRNDIIKNQGQPDSADADGNTRMTPEQNQKNNEKLSAANMYRTVKVCKNCFAIYTLLDQARHVLRKEEERSTSSRTKKRPQSKSGSPSEQDNATEITSVIKTPSKRKSKAVSRRLPARQLPSWKTRIPEEQLYGLEEVPRQLSKDQVVTNFEKLDTYLRGRSDEAARRCEMRAAALARSRAAQVHVAESAGCDAAELYFGRILLIERRNDSNELETIVTILESAGFVVDVELDARRAREILVSEFVPQKAGWQIDAVLVSDQLDLGDSFDIVKEVRSNERKHQERESKRVEDESKVLAMRPGQNRGASDTLAKAAEYTRLPVIIMTARTASEELRAYKEAGMDGCISKPVNRLALLSTVRAAIPRHGKILGDFNSSASKPMTTQAQKAQATRQSIASRTLSPARAAHQDIIVAFTVRIEVTSRESTQEYFNAERKAEFLAEVANQIGVLKSRVEIVSVSAKKTPLLVGIRVNGFPDDATGKGFIRALRARSQLLDDERWGRNGIEDTTMTDSTGKMSANGDLTESKAQALVGGAFGTSGTSSSAIAAQSLSLSASITAACGAVGGTLQIDADTSLPYTVIDFSLDAQGMRQRAVESNTFNLVVCHDFFDTLERMKIMLKPLAAKYPGLQVLLWNYPGQAFTEWREEQLLNNVYLASCLSELIAHVGCKGTHQFDDQCPFYLLGHGYGASVCSYYATHYRSPNVRGLLLFNGWSFVDPNLAGALHDSMNVFSCAPPTRPDLPVYFWTRFLFSREYLMKVSTPLALNLYTAVHNPITLKGRMKLCVGALSSHDVRPALKATNIPIIAVHSTEGILVKPLHAQPWSADSRCSTIHQALKSRKACVIWLKSGHEVFQEVRKQVSTLIEQVLVGYHEINDVAFIPAQYAESARPGSGGGSENAPKGHGNFEDNFIDNVLGKVRATKQSTGESRHAKLSEENGASSWEDFAAKQQQQVTQDLEGDQEAEDMHSQRKREGAQSRGRRKQTSKSKKMNTVLDPATPAFERQDNVVYASGKGSRIYPSPADYPEVKEYMGWRLKRNRKRLQRLELASRIIQNAFRNHLAWKIFQRLKRERSALFIQRAFRGHRGRSDFMGQMRRIWASMVIQRAWRGYAGRGFFLMMRTMHAASGQIQRVARGFLARLVIRRMVLRRNRAATMMQSLVRRWFARIWAFQRRTHALAARAVQRVYRGHLGRRRAENERHKYLFSKSQSQGIEFGRQMLLEHKLHATRLQSEVSLLTQEKVVTEESVEALLEEISEFEQGVNQLEKEMHQLSKIESEAVGVLDEEAKFELREQKMRLDKEFGSMLAKIAERRDRLAGLEGKLSTLDHSRQEKEEQLRTLERKLVVLLEEQQRELEKIKRRQDARGDLLTNARDEVASKDAGALVCLADGNNVLSATTGEGGGYGGPTVKEKKQAAQLMQSTETLMKFGFMSMSMTYFSSLNMIKAMRTVAAQDTVMAALHSKASGVGGEGGAGVPNNIGAVPYEDKAGGEPFKPTLRPGQMPGQEPLKVSAWSVDDVARWLQTLSLGQYREAFIDAAVDGAFLMDLNDDDLSNTLGIEHRLHRKKILNMTNKLKTAELERNRQLRILASAGTPAGQHHLGGPLPLDDYVTAAAGGGTERPLSPTGANQTAEEGTPAPVISIEELFGFVRHNKIKKLKEALESLPTRQFDPSLVKVAFVQDFGTAYVEEYEREYFNVNKVDEHGNSPLLCAAQNGGTAIAKLLIAKGANPNHQNKMGQSAGHYANAYQFYDFMGWLFDPNGGAADDTLENAYGLGVYDGLTTELTEG